MKRTMNRLFARLAILCVAVILGAIAVSQAQRGLQNPSTTANVGEETAPPSIAGTSPIPPADLTDINGQQPTGISGYGSTEPVTPIQPAPTEDFYGSLPATPPQDDYANAYQPAPVQQQPEETYVPETPAYQPPPAPAAADSATYLDLPEDNYGDIYSEPVTPDPSPVGEVVEYVAEAAEANLPDLPPILTPAEPSAAAPNIDSSFQTGPAGALAAELPPINTLPATPPIDVVPEPVIPEPVATAVTPREVGYPDEAYNPTPPAVNHLRSDDYTTVAETNITPVDSYGSVPTVPTPAAPNTYGVPTGAATLSVGAERQPRTASARSPFAQPGYNPVSGSGAIGSGRPGPTALEGPQSPTLVVTKNAPPEVQVGKVAKFEVTIRNVGAVDAKDVIVRDEVPRGAQLVETIPAAGKSPNGSLIWELGTIKAGAEVTVAMQIVPNEEGDIGSVATVAFQAAASAKSVATRPQLKLEHTGPGKVLVGNDVIFHIKLENPGSGTANNVVISEDVPAGLRHTDGRRMEYQVGNMQPGETRLIELQLKADQPGMVDNLLVAKADSGLHVEDHCPVEIIAPNIRVGIKGPRRRYLERRATFNLQVANPGTAPARGVELIAHMPRGLKFVSTNNAGQYNSQNHTVRWTLPELPAQEMGVVELTAIPEEIGSQKIRVETRAEMGLSDAVDHDLSVEGLAAILFTVTDATDPIEVGGQTTYEVRIVNQGSKIGTNVRLAALIPEGMVAVNGEGPTGVSIDGQRVLFEPLTRLAPQADAFYKIHVKGTSPGDKRIQVQLMSDDVQQPVTKEESTHVYSDDL